MKKDNIENKIWQILKDIPFGETRSYSYLAEKMKMKGKERYIASLLRKNPYLISIPCHRIVYKNGKVGGYVLGKDFKRYLLEWEKSMIK